MKSAVALFAFNRPETTARVFAAIRAARPSRLFIVCDGPRADRAGEAARCAAVRALLEGVDWPCEVERNYSDVNLGCRRRLSSGIAWVFSRVEEAVFLEDDTLPDPSFFPYCDEMLDRYRDDERVLMVCGYNALDRGAASGASYWFSAHPRVWGWAAWRRAWSGYDVAMCDWPSAKQTDAWRGRTRAERMHWGPFFDAVRGGAVDTWDAQLTLHAWRTGRLCAIPAVNLVVNIGFAGQATNTLAAEYPGPPSRALPSPLSHPAALARDTVLDARWVSLERGASPWRPRALLRRAFNWMRGQ